jgi:hypothetical protein
MKTMQMLAVLVYATMTALAVSAEVYSLAAFCAVMAMYPAANRD